MGVLSEVPRPESGTGTPPAGPGCAQNHNEKITYLLQIK